MARPVGQREKASRARYARALAETALWRKSDGGVRSREVKGESVGQGQGKGGSDRDNLTDPGEAVTTSEVRGGINSEEEGEKGIRVERMDGQRVGREERRDGGKERGRDRGEGVAVSF